MRKTTILETIRVSRSSFDLACQEALRTLKGKAKEIANEEGSQHNVDGGVRLVNFETTGGDLTFVFELYWIW